MAPELGAVVVGIELVGQVRVRVDEPRQQRRVAKIDDRGAKRDHGAANRLYLAKSILPRPPRLRVSLT